MGVTDIAILTLLTSVAFMAGYLMRGWFVDTSADDWPPVERRSDRYEPPRRNERI
jgi:hypothetical protein